MLLRPGRAGRPGQQPPVARPLGQGRARLRQRLGLPPQEQQGLRLALAQLDVLRIMRHGRLQQQQRALLGHPLVPRLVAEALLFEYRAAFAQRDGD